MRSFKMDETYVVFQGLGSIMVLMTGVDDIDELILADVMNCLQQTLSESFGASRLDSSILDIENYAKLSVLVDEIVCQVRYSIILP